jgi:hypothetical protein
MWPEIISRSRSNASGERGGPEPAELPPDGQWTDYRYQPAENFKAEEGLASRRSCSYQVLAPRDNSSGWTYLAPRRAGTPRTG